MANIRFLHPELERHGVLYAKLANSLDRDDMDAFFSKVNELRKHHPQLRVALEIEGKMGASAGAIWRKLKEGFGQINFYERIVYLGHDLWIRPYLSMLAAVLPIELKYYDVDQKPAAMNWLLEDRDAVYISAA